MIKHHQWTDKIWTLSLSLSLIPGQIMTQSVPSKSKALLNNDDHR